MQYWDIVEATRNILGSSFRTGSYGMHKYVLDEARPPTDEEIKQAFKILELPYGDKTNLEKNYKLLARKNHPDLGGSSEKMKELNWAKDVVDSVRGLDALKYDRAAEKEKQEANKKMFEVMWKSIGDLLHRANPHYEAYLGKWFPDIKGEPLEFIVAPYGGRGSVKWITSDKKTIFSIDLWLSYQETNGIGSGKSSEENIVISSKTELFNDNKKYKIKNSDFRGSRLTAELLDPKNTFPEAAVDRVASKTRSASKMQRRDFAGSLEHEFKAKYTGKDQWLVPIDDEWAFGLSRSTFKREGAYTVRFLYKNKKYVPDNGAVGSGTIFIPETQFGVAKLHKVVAFLHKEKDLVAAAKHVGAYTTEVNHGEFYVIMVPVGKIHFYLDKHGKLTDDKYKAAAWKTSESAQKVLMKIERVYKGAFISER